MIKAQTLKGFRDFMPQEARKRQYVIDTVRDVFKTYGFEPLETPVLEYEEILTGKYGEEGDKLMYRFEDNGGRRVAMRYDQTVPLARVIANYQNNLLLPFKRYQIQNVWRAENTQKGRYREFLQCDIDIIGIDSLLADAEIIATAVTAYQKLGFNNFSILINDRQVFADFSKEAIISIDKLKKIGEKQVCKELVQKNLYQSLEEAQKALQKLLQTEPTETISNLMSILDQMGVDTGRIQFSPTLARGLDYYTGIIIEIETPDYPYGSLGGGGRYNNLIGMFTDRQVPAVGFAFGFDRTMEAMEALQLYPADLALATSQVLVTVFSDELKENSLQICSQLRSNSISTEMYLGEIKEKNPLEKQLKYADQRNIPYVIILGSEEKEKNIVTLKNLKTREQKQLTLEECIEMLKK